MASCFVTGMLTLLLSALARNIAPVWWSSCTKASVGHIEGRALVLKVIRVGYYWPTMKEDYWRYAKRCEQFQRHADWHHTPAEKLWSIYSLWPFYTWGIDILGPFPLAIHQMKYLVDVNVTTRIHDSLTFLGATWAGHKWHLTLELDQCSNSRTHQD